MNIIRYYFLPTSPAMELSNKEYNQDGFENTPPYIFTKLLCQGQDVTQGKF